MANDKFVYVTYIRSTPEKVWDALTKPEFTRAYWFGIVHESSWEKGASWKMIFSDGGVADTGEVLEAERPKRLVLKWRNEFRPELKAEGYSRCAIEIESANGSVKLTIVHEIEHEHSKFIQAVSGGWPQIMASLKSLLETGEALARPEAKKN